MAVDRTIEIDIPDGTDVRRMLAAARARASGVGVTLSGDAGEGRFDGLAAGSWRVEGSRLVVVVEKKPAFLPWPVVLSKLEEAFR